MTRERFFCTRSNMGKDIDLGSAENERDVFRE